MKAIRIALYSLIVLGLACVSAVPLLLLSKFAPPGSPHWGTFNWHLFAREWAASGLRHDSMHEIYLLVWSVSGGALIYVLGELIKEVRASTDEARGARGELGGFPFIQYSTQSEKDITNLQTRFLQQYARLRYQPRFPPELQAKFEASLDVPHLLLTGRTGLGKTRECIELFLRLSKKKNEEYLILYPRDDFDRPSPRDIPADFSPRNLILFIDDIHRLCGPAGGNAGKADTSIRDFHDRLASTMQWIRERFAGADVRVVLTSRDDPELRARVRLDSEEVWSEFSVIHLHEIHRDQLREFARGIGNDYGLSIDQGALRRIARESDGTPFGIIHPLADEALTLQGTGRVLNVDDIANYTFCYPEDWVTNEYLPKIAPFLNRKSVFESLSACRQLGVPRCDFLVTELSARLIRRQWPVWKRVLWLWRTRRYITSTIRKELCNWMFEQRGEIICPNAYVENRVSVSEVMPQILSAFRRVLRGKRQALRLQPTIGGLSLRIGLDLGYPKEALKLVELCKSHGRTAALLTAESKLLARLGRDQESQRAAKAACEADPTNFAGLVLLSNAYSRIQEHDLAIKAAQSAVDISMESDYAWLNLGVVLSKRGQLDRAIVALERACELNPKSAKAWCSLGIAYDRNHELEKSCEACRRSTALDPTDDAAWLALGIACDRMENFRGAIAAFRRATALDPDNQASWLSLSRTLYSAGLKREGLVALRCAEAAARKRRDYGTLSTITVGYSKNREDRDAVRVAKEVLARHADNFEAQLSLVIALSNLQGNSEEARRARGRLAELCRSAEDWNNLSIAYGRARQHEEAVTAAKMALKVDPDYADAVRSLFVDLSKLSGKEGDAREARYRFKALAKSADDWYDLSQAFDRASESGEGLAAARRAWQIDPSHVNAARRCIAVDPNKFPGEAEEFRKAREQFRILAKSADDWYQLSKSFMRAGDLEQAVLAARKSLRLDPTRNRVRCALMNYLADIPDRAWEAREARKEFRKFAKSVKDWVDLSDACYKAGEHDEAIVSARKAVEVNPKSVTAARALFTVLSQSSGQETEVSLARARLEELMASAQDGPK